ncbi:uncharacterized protein BDZ99DRAFT_377553 [Mytilinidion resinicola]|uniref:EF-hand n=1 Tax=Mytilinidion resinicola TaxID=574789 RepID=A0A6A6Z0T9_9PEZI|nr:uncharacterized protein BDZ99DRAFT_377553 [Mytilinidion resinicola]KAF2814776.1 hypothetical protein BDZ99DRAFT_377553 [Mytilinidion resinicola]
MGLDASLIPQAFRRHDIAREMADRAQEVDDRESIAGTEVSWHTSHESGEDQILGDGQTLRKTLYHIAEERARQEGVKHRGVSCDQCDAKPIRGIRWRCANCADFDLCSDCEATNNHNKTHIFYKIRIPAPYLGLPKQAPVYPGRPNMMSPSIDSVLKRRLVSETNIEAEEIEALWDQFTCLADTEWREDPSIVGWAIDRRSFNQAFIPRYSTFTSAPNLIYDRVFAYYDSNNDGKIGYEEFVKGLDGMHSSKPEVKLRIVFNGYDIDGDGYISRKDVLRLFRAYYAIEKEGTRNYIAEITDELSVAGALDVIHSSQPLASKFTQDTQSSATTARSRRLHEKLPDQFGDLRDPFHGAVLDDTDDTAPREDVLGIATSSSQSRDPINRHLSDSPEEQRQDPVTERWRRRRFYVDEEEGLNEPEGHSRSEELSEVDEPIEASPNGHPESNGTNFPRDSRSSSRVRFQDDVDVETRSNASTSSRPFGERWGGYEIPEPEKDLGKELLYQITQQAFNEMLNPLFLDKEDLAMDAYDTKQERRDRRSELDAITATFARETQMNVNETICILSSHGYSRRMVELIVANGCTTFLQELKDGKHTHATAEAELRKIVSSVEAQLVDGVQSHEHKYRPTSQQLWNAKLWRIQFLHELSTTLLDMFAECGWIKNEQSNRVGKDIRTNNEQPYQDPTLPQFRPNSLADIDTTTIRPGSPLPSFTESPLTPLSQLSQYTTPDDDAASSDTDDNTEFIYQMDKGPIFFFPSSFIINDSNSAEYYQLPDPLPTSAEFLSAPLSISPHETSKLSPALFSFSFNPYTLGLDAHPHPFQPPPNSRLVFDITLALRRMASKPSSPCYLARLANLDAVEKEIQERKGEGLISEDEFMAMVMQDGKLRFLEAWMDWVNF